MIESDNSRTLALTIKNYTSAYGLSAHVHNNVIMSHGAREQFEVKGPLGTGLELETSGTYVVFAAGTGMLVFIDLVAHLILRLIANNGEINIFNDKAVPMIDLNSFKLILYTSFATREEAVGLEMIEALQNACKKYGHNNLFEFHSRISNDKSTNP